MTRKKTEQNSSLPLYETSVQPLASTLRPQSLDEVVGQQHLIGPGKPLRVALEQRRPMSFVLWGPPGVGKTTLARIYAKSLHAKLHELSAVSAGKDDVRKVIEAARLSDRPTVLFLDEIHRFNKAQQDFLLPYVENGTLILIGATTENPSFEIIGALLSRCRVFVLDPLTTEDMQELIKRTGMAVDKQTTTWLSQLTSGDARQLIGLMEAAHSLYGKVTKETVTQAGQVKLRYDKKGDEHYNTISAFIKSMRAGNANAAVYYLARMLEAGEDPKFIARRMIIFASEDVGIAQPTALVVANEVFRAVEVIGLPEAAINLSHGVVYLALAKKDRRAYDALRAAQKTVRATGAIPVPLKLRNAPTKLMESLGYGEGYEMYGDEDFLPEEIKTEQFWGEEKP
ncbi:MAG TPA: replication-associated recombination protein A [Verrucomicrobiae bacterium]|nr:replication-associated recombination protein A [Verrucomicrobiae bacterium]